MRILYFVPRYLPALGGIERHVAELATGMKRRGHEVTVVTQREDPAWPAEEQIDGVEVLRAASHVRFRGQGLSPSGWRLLRRLAAGADVVHLHNLHALSTPAASFVLPRRTYLLTPHYIGPGETPADRVMHRIYRPVAIGAVRRAERVICVSESEKAALEGDFGIPAQRVAVIPNGVKPRPITASPRPRARVLVAGRLEPYKHQDTVVRAMAFLPDDYWLVIAGTGPDWARLDDLAMRSGAADRIEFTGQLGPDDLARRYATASAVVSLSRRECFGMTLAEALSSATPVIGSDIPAHRDVLAGVPDDWYRLVPSEVSPSVLAEAIHRLVSEPPTSDRPRPTEWDEVVSRTLELYEQTVAVRSHA